MSDQLGFIDGKCVTHLETVTAVRFPVDQLHHLLVTFFSQCVTLCPVVSRASAIFVDIYVFRVVKVFEGGRLDLVDDLWKRLE